jgi:hypothetical protein
VTSPVRVRFAHRGPTGYLHVGAARVPRSSTTSSPVGPAVPYILRLEDTDTERNTDACGRATIYEGLRWIGLDPDEGPEQGGPKGLTANRNATRSTGASPTNCFHAAVSTVLLHEGTPRPRCANAKSPRA